MYFYSPNIIGGVVSTICDTIAPVSLKLLIYLHGEDFVFIFLIYFFYIFFFSVVDMGRKISCSIFKSSSSVGGQCNHATVAQVPIPKRRARKSSLERPKRQILKTF